MPALFDLLETENERAVLGHWLFGYIHPYPDGNGRRARFVMNAMLASGGYPWTVIQAENRAAYLSALESASIDQDIAPFARFAAERCDGRWSRLRDRWRRVARQPEAPGAAKTRLALPFDGEEWGRLRAPRTANHFGPRQPPRRQGAPTKLRPVPKPSSATVNVAPERRVRAWTAAGSRKTRSTSAAPSALYRRCK